jgi:glycosyltransferase involved in cell wall biosynthesis
MSGTSQRLRRPRAADTGAGLGSARTPRNKGYATPVTRLAIFASLESSHGRARLLFEVARVLLTRGHQVDIVVPRPGADLRDRLPAGARLVELAPRWLPTAWARRAPVYAAIPALARYLRRARPALVLGGSIPPNVSALLARRLSGLDLPVVLRQSNVLRISGDPDYGGIAPRRRDWMVRRFFRHADAVIAVSDGVADNLVKAAGVDPSRVRAVPAGIDADVDARAAEPLSHPWFQAGQPPVLVNVGRQVPKKDQATLLRALKRLRAKADVRLVILGGRAAASPSLDTLIAELGLGDAVDRPGSVDNVFPYLARASAFVLSSISEGMPNALLEAMASGCPVVSTDCPSGPHELLEGGRHAPLVPVGDDAALAAAIERVLADPPDTRPLRTRAAAFSVTRSAEAYADILETLVRPRAAGATGADLNPRAEVSAAGPMRSR